MLEIADTCRGFNYLSDIMTKRKRTIIIISSIISVIWILFVFTGMLSWFDLKALDFFVARSPALEQDSSIVVVEYDDKTAENLSSPATRLDIAALVHIIEEQKPRVLALDIFSLYGLLNREDTTMLFEEVLSQYNNICYGIGFIVPVEKENDRRSNEYIDEFKYLNKFLYPLHSIEKTDNLYYAEHLFKPTYQYYARSKSIGHLVLKNDVDGVFRRIPALIQCGEGALATLGLQAAFDFLGMEKEDIRLKAGKISVEDNHRMDIPVDKKGLMMIRYNDRLDKIKEISMIDVLGAYKNEGKRILDLGVFKDKLVFIGNTSSRTARFCATPLHSYYPTILLHANVANNVMQKSFLRSMNKGLLIALIILFCVLYSSLISRSKNIIRTSILLSIALLLLIFAIYILTTQLNYYIPLFSLTSFIIVLFGSLLIYRYITYKDYLLISLKELQEAMRLKERLAAIGEVSSKVAHEIRNPLNAIQLYTNLIKRESREEGEAQEHLNIIHEETQRLNRFITKLLGFARPKEPSIKSMNLKNELNFVLNILLPDAKEKNIDVDINDVKESTIILGDPDQLRECFINLAKNSVEAMENNGKFTIYSIEDKEYISIFFKDTGKGIPKEDREKIFNPFYSTKKSGTGLGLPMVKKIIEAHRGKINIESEPGQGTVIEIRLPLKKDTLQKGRADEEV